MDLADPRVDANIEACEQGLKRLLHTKDSDVFMYASNGHGVWEAVVENIAAPGAAVLVPGTGHFSESWAIQTKALGRRVVRTAWREGWPIDAAAVEQALRDDRKHAIKAVLMVHTDTASGVTATSPPCAGPSTPPAIPRFWWRTWSRRWPPLRFRWMRCASTWPSALRRKA